jgi:hypothetical protein
MDRTRMLGTVMGVTRLGVGGALAIAPSFAGRLWLGDAADTPNARVLARSVGTRDAIVGAATLAALRNRKPTAQLLTIGFAGGLADAVSTTVAGKHLDPQRRWMMPSIAISVATMGLAATRMALAADRMDPDATDPTDELDLGEAEVADITGRASTNNKKAKAKEKANA